MKSHLFGWQLHQRDDLTIYKKIKIHSSMLSKANKRVTYKFRQTFQTNWTGLGIQLQNIKHPVLFQSQIVLIHSRLNREKTELLPTGTKRCLLRGGGVACGGLVSCRVLDSSHQFPQTKDKTGQAASIKNTQTKTLPQEQLYNTMCLSELRQLSFTKRI